MYKMRKEERCEGAFGKSAKEDLFHSIHHQIQSTLELRQTYRYTPIHTNIQG